MKVVILAGGRPSTITDEHEGIPKPMAEIGGRPLIWHIMKSFSTHGFNDFIICGGYKVDMIKEYFMNYHAYESDITIDLHSGNVDYHNKPREDWRVTVVDTGIESPTALRISMVQNYIKDDDFIVTYGDCLSDIAFEDMVVFHKNTDKIATMAVAGTTGRNEALRIDDNGKLLGKAMEVEGAWTNACIYILKKEIFKYLAERSHLEQYLMSELVPLGELVTYKHFGFWSPVETYRDRMRLESMWNSETAPWIKGE